MNKKVLNELLSWVIIVVIAFALAFLMNRFVILTISSPTPSMENTFLVGEKVLTFRLAYVFSEPKRGDIVVFPNPDDESEDYIKRIIGLPGEVIEGIDGVVYINGEPLTENYLKEPMEKEDFGPYEIPSDCYFMMGDNRNDSLDARYWEHKFVEGDKIKSKAIFKYPKFKWFKRIDYGR